MKEKLLKYLGKTFVWFAVLVVIYGGFNVISALSFQLTHWDHYLNWIDAHDEEEDWTTAGSGITYVIIYAVCLFVATADVRAKNNKKSGDAWQEKRDLIKQIEILQADNQANLDRVCELEEQILDLGEEPV